MLNSPHWECSCGFAERALDSLASLLPLQGCLWGWDQRSEGPEDRCPGGGAFWSLWLPPSCRGPSLATPQAQCSFFPSAEPPALAQVSSPSAQHLPHPRVSPFQASRNSLYSSPLFRPTPRLLLDIRGSSTPSISQQGPWSSEELISPSPQTERGRLSPTPSTDHPAQS